MLFLRLALFVIIALGALAYLITLKIRSEFINTGEKINPLFRGTRIEYKAFCKKPPTAYAVNLLKTRKKLLIALTIAVFVLLLALLAVVLEQA